MKVPNDFKKIIADTFYDKEMILSNLEAGFESDGGPTQTKKVVKTFKGNKQPTNRETMLKEYGIDIEAEFTVTTHEDIEALKSTNAMQMIDNYAVLKVLPFDTHYLVAVKSWKL